jgi:hypothetical protein
MCIARLRTPFATVARTLLPHVFEVALLDLAVGGVMEIGRQE